MTAPVYAVPACAALAAVASWCWLPGAGLVRQVAGVAAGGACVALLEAWFGD